eukprot:5487208-Alexandrium_andersonii.AAC.1
MPNIRAPKQPCARLEASRNILRHTSGHPNNHAPDLRPPDKSFAKHPGTRTTTVSYTHLTLPTICSV